MKNQIDPTLQTLLEASPKEKFALTQEDVEWLYAMPVGNEILDPTKEDVIGLAKQLFNGDLDTATQWLNIPLPILSNKTPLQAASDPNEIHHVVHLIGRLRYGKPN